VATKILKSCKSVNGGTVHVSLSLEGMDLLTADGVEKLTLEAMEDFPWLRKEMVFVELTGNTFVPQQAGVGFDMPSGKALPAYYEVRHTKIYR